MRLAGLSSLVAAALLASTSAYAGKADDTLHVAFTKEVENVDVYYTTAREGLILSHSIWDGLVHRDPASGDYVGNLATQWRWVDDTTLEFDLREGVKFHNGEPFDADDVVATVNYVVDPKNGVKAPKNVNWMKSAEKIDQYKVRIHLAAPFPAALEFLSSVVPMYPNEYYAKVGSTGMAKQPVGTGPYKVESVEPGRHFVLKKNEDHFGGPKADAAIETVDIRTIPEINTQLAELATGGLDLIWGVPTDQAQMLDAQGGFNVVNEETMRVGYMTMDAAKRTSGDTPMANKKVREAINYAIDRKGIVDALVQGSSEVINSACSPIQFGCDQDVKVYDYDPEKAKKLLEEAGYGDGFSIEFYAYRDRPYAEALMNNLAAVGIRTNLNFLQYAALADKVRQDGIPLGFMTWGSNSIADVSAILPEFFGGGGQDQSRDEEVQKAIVSGDTSIDKDARAKSYSKALNRIADEAYWVPLWTYGAYYAMSQDTNFKPTSDEIVRFFDVTWN
ncbi:ABC transporter substrate-binding protein [Jiella pacifica]|uniref:ABC transporter substrate-binding protein n=1 Tax=Jiella pacifica TaxID=2696469 RepID=A0A6N9T2Z3_9HYPH|nr:ABC transporter substrate-binding protein [Jiella pacifica]NDW05650.1 ABC transporter substrate-binding protein [Jiella pacifica]